jgi:hypothetical protein
MAAALRAMRTRDEVSAEEREHDRSVAWRDRARVYYVSTPARFGDFGGSSVFYSQ